MTHDAGGYDDPDPIVSPDNPARIMHPVEDGSPPDRWAAAYGTPTEDTGDEPDIESTAEATGEAWTSHMDDDDSDPEPSGVDGD